MRRTKEEAEQTKADILRAALAVFSQTGYEAARLNDIAERAEVTRGAIYHHFDSKAGLYLALIEDASELGDKAINQAIQEGGTLAEIIERILIYSLNLLEDDQRFRQVTSLSLFQATSQPDLKPLEERRAAQAVELVGSIEAFFEQGQQAGQLRPDVQAASLARAFLAYQNGLALLWLANPKAFSIKAQAPQLAAVFMQGIVT